MAFCQYCGTNVEEGTVCNCDAAVQARAAASNPTPSNSAPAPQTYAPASPKNPSQASETAKATMSEVSGTLKAFIKDPMAVTSSDKSIGVFAAATLLVIQALCLALFVWFFSADLRTLATDNIEKAKSSASKADMTFSAYVSDAKADAKEYISNYEKSSDKKASSFFKMMGMAEVNNLSYNSVRFIIYLIIISLLNSAVIFGLLFLCAKLFKSGDDYTKILSTVSLASIPWSIMWLVFTIIKFVTEKASGTLISLVLALMIFVFIASVCLLFSGLTKSFQNSYKRLLSISLTYSVGVPVYFFIAGKFLESAPLFGSVVTEFMKILVSNSLPGIF